MHCRRLDMESMKGLRKLLESCNDSWKCLILGGIVLQCVYEQREGWRYLVSYQGLCMSAGRTALCIVRKPDAFVPVECMVAFPRLF
jgi:hypothetical protein